MKPPFAFINLHGLDHTEDRVCTGLRGDDAIHLEHQPLEDARDRVSPWDRRTG